MSKAVEDVQGGLPVRSRRNRRMRVGVRRAMSGLAMAIYLFAQVWPVSASAVDEHGKKNGEKAGGSKLPRSHWRWFGSAGGGWHTWLWWSDDDWSTDPKYNVFGSLRTGLRWKYLELSTELLVYHQRQSNWDAGYTYDLYGALFGFGFSVYSLRSRWVRLRHGLHLGVWVDGISRHCESGDVGECNSRLDDLGSSASPGGRLQLLEVLVKIYRGVWIEICPATFGIPLFYTPSVHLRLEIGLGH